MEKSEFVWLNDGLAPLSQARVSVNDRGFLYGDGFFETMRARDGRVEFLKEHLARLKASTRAFRLPFQEAFPWEETIGRLLTANGLGDGPAAVKLQLTRGIAPELGLPAATAPTLIVWARPYIPPSLQEYNRGWPVVTFPERRSTFLGRHKSLNYLFYLAARQYAQDQGAREALILEAEGRVSEGAATSLIYARDGQYYCPKAMSALPGITQAVLARALARRGLKLQPAVTRAALLKEAEGLWLANSLMGLMPVASLDGIAIPIHPSTGLLNKWLEDEG